MLETTGKKKYKNHPIIPDPLYGNVMLSKFINHVMRQGKKSVAQGAVYDALEKIKTERKQEPLDVFENALNNVMPSQEVRSKRVGGATYQVPMKVEKKRAISLAMRWIVAAARKKKGKPMNIKLFEELVEAAENRGEAVQKKENMHKMAKANKAFAYLAK